MFATFIIFIYFVSVCFGIYILDYAKDGKINQVMMILLSIIASFIVVIIVLFFVLEILYFIYGKHYPKNSIKKHKVAKWIVKALLDLLNIQYEVHNSHKLPKNQHFVIYSNHTSELDIPLLMNAFKEYPIAFLAKHEMKQYPSIGKWAEAIGSVMLNRENNRQGVLAIKKTMEHIDSGIKMVVFPEGTIKREVGVLLDFKTGAFKIALSKEVPCVVVVIKKEPDYNKKHWPQKRKIVVIVKEVLQPNEFKHMKTSERSKLIKKLMLTELKKQLM